jgi:hypothetical protein
VLQIRGKHVAIQLNPVPLGFRNGLFQTREAGDVASAVYDDVNIVLKTPVNKLDTRWRELLDIRFHFDPSGQDALWEIVAYHRMLLSDAVIRFDAIKIVVKPLTKLLLSLPAVVPWEPAPHPERKSVEESKIPWHAILPHAAVQPLTSSACTHKHL